MYYHTLTELAVKESNRLWLQEGTHFESLNQFDNCGKTSYNDEINNHHLTEKRVMSFINELLTKVNEVGISSLVSIPFISKSLNIPEELLTTILQKNGLELTTVEEEEE